MDFLVEYESFIRLAAFAGVLVLITLIEWKMAFRKSRLLDIRWLSNLSLTFVNTLLVKVLLPLGAMGVAYWAVTNNVGLFNVVNVPTWLAIIVGVLILDWVIWFQHLLVHRVPLFWRFHRVHHSDPEYDATTALRFHPVEILFSMLIKITITALFGIPVAAVILFEVILNGMALFNHGNFRLPSRAEAILNKVWVTPDFHRIHHSIKPKEHHSNFGFNLSIWDRMFGTCTKPETIVQEQLVIGLTQFDNRAETTKLTGLLTIPFK